MGKLRSQQARGLAEGFWFLLLRETGILQRMPLAASEIDILELLLILIYNKILTSFTQLLSETYRSKIM